MDKTNKITRPPYDRFKLISTGIGLFALVVAASFGVNWLLLYLFNDDSNMGVWYVLLIIWLADYILTGRNLRKDMHKIKSRLNIED